MLNFMNFWFIVYGLPQCYAQDDSNTCMPWLCPNLHVCHAVAHLGLQFYNFYAEMWDWDDDYNRSELNLNLNLTEMVQAGLSFSLAEVRKWMVHMLCPREWQTLCALMAWIFSRGDGFFNVSLPGTVAGNLHLLKRLCLPKYLWDYQEWRKILGCSILCLQHVTSISFSGLFNSQAVSGFLGIKGSAVLSNQHWKFNTSLKVRTVIWVKKVTQKINTTAERSLTTLKKMCGWSDPIFPWVLKILSASKVKYSKYGAKIVIFSWRPFQEVYL